MKDEIIAILKKTLRDGFPVVELSVPDEPSFGHYSTNAAMRLAKQQGRKPMELATELAAEISTAAPVGFFARVEAVAPGFINFWLSNDTMCEHLAEVARNPKFGCGTARAGKTALVEFTDPNPFKEFHIGHLMSNAIGESVSRLIESQGATVNRLSYGGDIGLHVAKAMFGVLQKKDEIQAVKQKSEKEQLSFWAAAYVAGSSDYDENEDAKKKIDDLNKVLFDKSDAELNELYGWGRTVSIDAFQIIFKRLDTRFVRNYWESEVVGFGMKAVEDGLAKNILERSEGAVVFKGEPYGLHTRVFVNSRGVPTYEAKELGITEKKHEDFVFDTSIVITGNEQNDYFKVLLKVIDLLIPELAGKTTHISHGMLRFSSGKMSSRKGNVIIAESLIDQAKVALAEKVNERSGLDDAERATVTEAIAVGAIKYSILKQNPGQDIVFDFEKSLSFDGDSGPYLQYAHARLRSILRKAHDEFGIKSAENFAALDSENELALVRKIFEFPDVVARAAEALTPSGVATYLHKLAVAANKFYETTPILKDENEARRAARLALAEIAARTLASGLNLLGMKALEKI
jgi:arginyl-tRNA synthetase